MVGAGREGIEVSPEALGEWLGVFRAEHGELTMLAETSGLMIRAADEAGIRLEALCALDAVPGPRSVEAAVSLLRPADRVGVVLIRRGGYAVGLGSGAVLAVHKCGSRYVQGKTAAGGTSQHRYARRRDNQASALVDAVSSLVADRIDRPDAMVLGGDRSLVREVLADRRLQGLKSLPRRDFYDVSTPNLAALRHALWRGRAVRITPEPPSSQ